MMEYQSAEKRRGEVCGVVEKNPGNRNGGKTSFGYADEWKQTTRSLRYAAG